MARILTILLAAGMCSLACMNSSAAGMKIVSEYRYPTSFEVTPIMGTDANGNSAVIGGIVTPSGFETREVGVAMNVEAAVGSLAGLASASRPGTLVNGNTDLMLAATVGDYKRTRKLSAGTDVNQQNRFGSTALMGASAGGFEDIVKLLLLRGADGDLRSESGSTALMFAARNGHEDVVRALLKDDAEPNGGDADGNSALMYAVRGGHADVVRLLLAGGANANAPDPMGRTPLMVAQEMAQRDMVVLLTPFGSD